MKYTKLYKYVIFFAIILTGITFIISFSCSDNEYIDIQPPVDEGDEYSGVKYKLVRIDENHHELQLNNPECETESVSMNGGELHSVMGLFSFSGLIEEQGDDKVIKFNGVNFAFSDISLDINCQNVILNSDNQLEAEAHIGVEFQGIPIDLSIPFAQSELLNPAYFTVGEYLEVELTIREFELNLAGTSPVDITLALTKLFGNSTSLAVDLIGEFNISAAMGSGDLLNMDIAAYGGMEISIQQILDIVSDVNDLMIQLTGEGLGEGLLDEMPELPDIIDFSSILIGLNVASEENPFSLHAEGSTDSIYAYLTNDEAPISFYIQDAMENQVIATLLFNNLSVAGESFAASLNLTSYGNIEISTDFFDIHFSMASEASPLNLFASASGLDNISIYQDGTCDPIVLGIDDKMTGLLEFALYINALEFTTPDTYNIDISGLANGYVQFRGNVLNDLVEFLELDIPVDPTEFNMEITAADLAFNIVAATGSPIPIVFTCTDYSVFRIERNWQDFFDLGFKLTGSAQLNSLDFENIDLTVNDLLASIYASLSDLEMSFVLDVMEELGSYDPSDPESLDLSFLETMLISASLGTDVVPIGLLLNGTLDALVASIDTTPGEPDITISIDDSASPVVFDLDFIAILHSISVGIYPEDYSYLANISLGAMGTITNLIIDFIPDFPEMDLTLDFGNSSYVMMNIDADSYTSSVVASVPDHADALYLHMNIPNPPLTDYADIEGGFDFLSTGGEGQIDIEFNITDGSFRILGLNLGVMFYVGAFVNGTFLTELMVEEGGEPFEFEDALNNIQLSLDMGLPEDKCGIEIGYNTIEEDITITFVPASGIGEYGDLVVKTATPNRNIVDIHPKLEGYIYIPFGEDMQVGDFRFDTFELSAYGTLHIDGYQLDEMGVVSMVEEMVNGLGSFFANLELTNIVRNIALDAQIGTTAPVPVSIEIDGFIGELVVGFTNLYMRAQCQLDDGGNKVYLLNVPDCTSYECFEISEETLGSPLNLANQHEDKMGFRQVALDFWNPPTPDEDACPVWEGFLNAEEYEKDSNLYLEEALLNKIGLSTTTGGIYITVNASNPGILILYENNQINSSMFSDIDIDIDNGSGDPAGLDLDIMIKRFSIAGYANYWREGTPSSDPPSCVGPAYLSHLISGSLYISEVTIASPYVNTMGMGLQDEVLLQGIGLLGLPDSNEPAYGWITNNGTHNALFLGMEVGMNIPFTIDVCTLIDGVTDEICTLLGMSEAPFVIDLPIPIMDGDLTQIMP